MMLPPTITGIYQAASKWAVLALVCVGFALTGYFHGRHVVEGENASAQLDIALAYAGEIVKTQSIADGLMADNTALRTTQAPKDRIITKEITRYVQVTPPDQRCVLPGTFRVRHDAAATGVPPERSAAGPVADATAAPVEDATVLDTVGDNYAACREASAQLEGWQRRQRSLETAK